MDKALIDSSTFFDIRKASKNVEAPWAQNTIYRLVQYQAQHPKLTISAFPIFEHLDGLHRQGRVVEADRFLTAIVPSLEVIYPDEAIYALSAQINASLSLAGTKIGVADTFIAATAISRGLTLVNANTRHFERIQAVGFPLNLENWRES